MGPLPMSITRTLRPQLVLAFALALLALVLAPAARADQVTFGSPLNVPATKDTTNDLGYAGWTYTFHVFHDGADTDLWNPTQASGNPQAPAAGQVLAIKQEGCAVQAPGGPTPLTQIGFEELTRQADGTYKVVAATEHFELPVCGANGASGSTITTYQPSQHAFCVNAGDYVAFNDEGGFGTYYPSGVPYRVIGSVSGSSMVSYIRNAGTMLNAVIHQNDVTNHDGYLENSGKEVMTQVVLGTGADASYRCAGGAKDKPLEATSAATGGQVSKRGVLDTPVFCHGPARCSGVVTIKGATFSLSIPYKNLPVNTTRHIRLKFSMPVLKALFQGRNPAAVTLTIQSSDPTEPVFTRSISLRASAGLARKLKHR